MIRAATAALALLAATQAAALTCAPPDPAASFRMAQESPERYVVLYGTLSADPSLFPGDTDPDPDPAPVPGTFAGHSLTPEGFTRDASGPVVIQPTCAGPWCGGPPGTAPVLAFARVTGTGLLLEVDPCFLWTIPDPAPATLELMAACLRGEACGP